jgi:hypothetical protein
MKGGRLDHAGTAWLHYAAEGGRRKQKVLAVGGTLEREVGCAEAIAWHGMHAIFEISAAT